MSAKKKVIFIVIPLLTVTIGWIMEIMPDAIGEGIQKVFGEQYPLFWWIITSVLVLALILCSYWSATDESNSGGNRKIIQRSGKDSENTYTEHNSNNNSRIGNRDIEQHSGDNSKNTYTEK